MNLEILPVITADATYWCVADAADALGLAPSRLRPYLQRTSAGYTLDVATLPPAPRRATGARKRAQAQRLRAAWALFSQHALRGAPAPSVRDVQRALRLSSTSTAQQLIRTLLTLGYLETDVPPGRAARGSRGIRVVIPLVEVQRDHHPSR